MRNPIIAELRCIRDENARRYNFDVEAMARDLMKLDPLMKKRTYTLCNGKMVPVSTVRAKRRLPIRRRKSVRKRNGR